MRVYHRTTAESAESIRRTGAFTSREQGSVCVSNRLNGQAVGYGPAVVRLDIPVRLLTLDDQFPGGERHYRVPASDITPDMIVDGHPRGESRYVSLHNDHLS